MFGSGDFWDKSPSRFFQILKLPSFYSGNFQLFKNALGQFIQNRPPKDVTTSTKLLKKYQLCQEYQTNLMVLKKAVVKSQFNYCTLVWVFCSRTSNNMVNKVMMIKYMKGV